MTEVFPRKPRLRAVGVGMGTAGPTFRSLTRQYRHPGDRPEPTPAEIVAALHERMAASSPRLAVLVAVYRDVKTGRREPLTPAEIRRELGPEGAS